jgi:hypothetical protein
LFRRLCYGDSLLAWGWDPSDNYSIGTQRFKFLFLTNKKFIFICFGRDIIKKKKSNKSEVCWEVDSGLAHG